MQAVYLYEMSEGFTVKQRGEQLGESTARRDVSSRRGCANVFAPPCLITSVNMPRGTRLAVKQFKRTKSSNRILREAEFQQQAAAVGVAPVIVGVHLDDKYIVMERADALIIDLYRWSGTSRRAPVYDLRAHGTPRTPFLGYATTTVTRVISWCERISLYSNRLWICQRQ